MSYVLIQAQDQKQVKATEYRPDYACSSPVAHSSKHILVEQLSLPNSLAHAVMHPFWLIRARFYKPSLMSLNEPYVLFDRIPSSYRQTKFRNQSTKPIWQTSIQMKYDLAICSKLQVKQKWSANAENSTKTKVKPSSQTTQNKFHSDKCILITITNLLSFPKQVPSKSKMPRKTSHNFLKSHCASK